MSPRVDPHSQLHLRGEQTPWPRLGASLEGARTPAPGEACEALASCLVLPTGRPAGLGILGGTATPHGDSPPLRPAHIAHLNPGMSVGGCRVTGTPSPAETPTGRTLPCAHSSPRPSPLPGAAVGPGRAPSSSVQLAGTPLVGREKHTSSPVKTQVTQTSLLSV